MIIDSPGLLAAFPTVGAAEPVTTYGSWRPGEFRTVDLPAGRLVLVGQCPASDRVLREDFQRALDADRLEWIVRWPGSYLAVVVRPEDVTVFVDLAGQYPVYYLSAAGRTVLGTRPGETARYAGLRPEPDVLTLLTEVFCPGVPIAASKSPYRGLHRLGGGQALRIGRDGRCRTWIYETLLPGATSTLEEAAHALRAALEQAVRSRAAAGMTADFSGGLDSTSIAFLAARHRNEDLPVFTYHHPEAPAEDVEHAERYLELDRRLRANFVHGTRNTLTYQGLDSASPTDVPDPGAVTHRRTQLRLQYIADVGSTVHLNGEGADALLVAAPGYLGDLVRCGTLRRFGRECRELARERDVAPVRVLARSAKLSARPLRRALRMFAERLERPPDRHVEWLDAIAWWPGPGREAAWLNPPFRRELADCLREAAETTTVAARVGDLTALSEVRAAGTVQGILDHRARQFGIWPQAPFLDNDVVRACLMLPAYRRADANARKPLLGMALTGLVPGEVFARRTKGNYIGEDYRGVRLAAGELMDRVSRMRLVEFGVIDPEPVRASVRRAAAGLPAPFPALNRLLGADLWMSGLGKGRS
ncbi:asparagine synthase-related protein [Amycolatopsis sp. NPDC005003]